MKLQILLLMMALALLAALAYVIPRTEFLPFITCYASLFVGYAYWVYRAPKTFEVKKWRYYLGAALLLRLVFVAAMPELSDDFWRYLWDGRLLSHGVNPYQFIPSELQGTSIYEQANLAQLYPHLNSPKYYSVYPPLTQLLFAAATFFFPSNILGSVLLLRLFTIILELGTIVLLCRYLRHNNNVLHWAFVYAFNPLIILELSGNLHTESLMLFFMILVLYLWSKEYYYRSAVAFSFAIAAKLIPLMLLPFFCWRLLTARTSVGGGLRWDWRGFKQALVFGLIVCLMNLALFALFYDWAMIQKIRTSMALYFQYFEFNASVYYFLRYQILNEYWRLWDYHEYFMKMRYIEEALRWEWYVVLRRVLPIITLLGILGLSFRHRSTTSMANCCLWISALCFCMGTTIHPWYISSLVLFSVLTNYRFPLVWSAMIGATYISYQGGSFQEQTWVIITEYSVVGGALCWDWYQHRFSKITTLSSKNQKTIPSPV